MGRFSWPTSLVREVRFSPRSAWWLASATVLVGIVVVVVALASGSTAQAVEPEAGMVTHGAETLQLKGASGGQGVRFGAVASVSPVASVPPAGGRIRLGFACCNSGLAVLDNPAAQTAIATADFDSVTPENAMKFAETEPNQGQFSWTGADKVVNFAAAHTMRVRGHTLVWYLPQEIPGWVNGLSNTQAAAALKNHIQTLVTRYQGKVTQWDVVNEALNDDGTLRDSVWRQKLGNDYVAQAFTWAREADPSAQLFYNDYGIESRDLDGNGGTGRAAKSDAAYAMVKDFKARGIPIDGVGFQAHSSGEYPGGGPAIQSNIERFGALGVKVEITELDVINHGDVASQAARYAAVGSACRATVYCTGVTTWGLYDGDTWRGAASAPLLLDTTFHQKPAYTALVRALGR